MDDVSAKNTLLEHLADTLDLPVLRDDGTWEVVIGGVEFTFDDGEATGVVDLLPADD
jgi:hypothetical protein